MLLQAMLYLQQHDNLLKEDTELGEQDLLAFSNIRVSIHHVITEGMHAQQQPGSLIRMAQPVIVRAAFLLLRWTFNQVRVCLIILSPFL